jgi:hypothetical protein
MLTVRQQQMVSGVHVDVALRTAATGYGLAAFSDMTRSIVTSN